MTIYFAYKQALYVQKLKKCLSEKVNSARKLKFHTED